MKFGPLTDGMTMNRPFWMPVVTAAVPSVGGPDNGLAEVASRHGVAETIDRLEALARAKGLTVFARIDFAGDAAKAGLTMPPTQLLIFGNPKAGTPLMLAAPGVAIDLPLKALAWEASDGRTWISYNTPDYLKRRHALPEALLPNIAGIQALVQQAAE
jgi:uncharacterized protein (DUF302 family)